MSKYYSNKELILRIVWGLCYPLLFRYSPRLFYGWRNWILRIFGASIKQDVKVYPSARIMFPWLLQIEEGAVISWGVNIYNLGLIRIGARTIVSQYTHLCGGSHDHKTPDFTLLRMGLTIGRDVWIAADAFIGPGVKVGDNAIVAARSVVIKDVPEGTIVGGNPARVIKRRA